MSCRRCKQIVQELVLGLCIACSILSGHGGDDDVFRSYAMGQTSPPAAVASGTSGTDVTIQLTGVQATTAVGVVSASTR